MVCGKCMACASENSDASVKVGMRSSPACECGPASDAAWWVATMCLILRTQCASLE